MRLTPGERMVVLREFALGAGRAAYGQVAEMVASMIEIEE